MKNSEILKNILKEMEENHLNLYHDVSKEEIENYISTIKNIDDLDTVSFDYEMLKLFNKFKDAHTMYYIPLNNINIMLYYIENQLLIKEDNTILKITSIGGMSTKTFLNKLKNTQTYETKEFMNDSIRYAINNGYYYKMFGLLENDEITYEVIDEQSNTMIRKAKIISLDEFKKLSFYPYIPFYNLKTLNDNILYIKYRKCAEHQGYSFKDFVKEVKKEIELNSLSKFIIDLRDNHGGNSSIIKPLIELLKKKELEGVTIINNGVFSSGRWAVANLVENFNTPLIGEPTGGAATSFGNTKNLNVEDKRFSVSTKFWDFSNIFGDSGSIQPDIYVPYTIKDLKEGTDSQLDVAINYITKKQELKFD